MAKLNDFAKDYIPKQTKNIADLEVVPTDADIMHDGKGVDKDGEEFTYSYLKIGAEEYRIPNSVIGQLKDILEANPKSTRFKVKKSGEGLGTRYTVIPIM